MKFVEFRNIVKNYPLFRSTMLEHFTSNAPLLRRQLSDWVKQGHVLQLKRGFYILNNDDRKINVSRYFLANQLYSPSFISLEAALSYYGFIPEAVHAMTSISSKKTQSFTNVLGKFIYHHIKPSCYGDYIKQQDEFGNSFFIASKERAIVDFLYLRTNNIVKPEEDIFEESFRLQNFDTLNCESLQLIAEKFQQKKLDKLIHLLIRKIKNYD